MQKSEVLQSVVEKAYVISLLFKTHLLLYFVTKRDVNYFVCTWKANVVQMFKLQTSNQM